ncbi:MAG: hypothetical protein JNL98_09080 [Bryobacterales bacterium]|nr:hypothetical protein [Bryobacterales bacterium]
MIQPTVFNITTLCLLVLTIWVTWTRHRTQLENNWPLFYYLLLGIYSKKFEESFDPTVIFLTIVMAFLLRFEFLGGRPLLVVKVLESIGLVYIALRCIGLVFG